MLDHDEPTWRSLCAAVRDAPVGIGVCDEDGRMIAVSTSLAESLNHTMAEIVGRPFLAFVHPEDRGASLAAYFEAVVAAAAGVRGGRTRVRCLTGDGGTIAVEVNWTVTEGDETTSPCGILYLTRTPASSAPAVSSPQPGRSHAALAESAGCDAS